MHSLNLPGYPLHLDYWKTFLFYNLTVFSKLYYTLSQDNQLSLVLLLVYAFCSLSFCGLSFSLSRNGMVEPLGR